MKIKLISNVCLYLTRVLRKFTGQVQHGRCWSLLGWFHSEDVPVAKQKLTSISILTSCLLPWFQYKYSVIFLLLLNNNFQTLFHETSFYDQCNDRLSTTRFGVDLSLCKTFMNPYSKNNENFNSIKYFTFACQTFQSTLTLCKLLLLLRSLLICLLFALCLSWLIVPCLILFLTLLFRPILSLTKTTILAHNSFTYMNSQQKQLTRKYYSTHHKYLA